MRSFCISLSALCCGGSAFSQVSAEQTLEAAMVLGITAETMACADIHGQEVAMFFDRLASDFVAYGVYHNSLAATAAIHAEFSEARAAARLDSHDPAAASTLADVNNRLAVAQAEADLFRESLVLNLTESLSASPSLALSVIECPLGCSVPPAYRPADLTNDERRVLAWALRLRDQRPGASLPPDAVAAISSAESFVGVQLAILRREQFVASNQAAINTWLNGQN